jgi:hypothetical protein
MVLDSLDLYPAGRKKSMKDRTEAQNIDDFEDPCIS